MANVTFDKKQLPQVAALGTLSACVFGYFGFKMIAPPATQAAPPSNATATTPASGSGGASVSASDPTGAKAGDVDASALIGAPAPSAAMRDPFAAASLPAGGSQSPSTQPAVPDLQKLSAPNSGKKAGAAVPSLPSGGDITALPGPSGSAPAAPPAIVSPAAQWSVTGVICSDTDPSLSLAIFRSGNVRRYVRVGEYLDNVTCLVRLDRAGVVLTRAGMRFRLEIGGTADSPSAVPPQQHGQTQPSAAAPTPSAGASVSLPTLQQKAELPTPAAQPAGVVTAVAGDVETLPGGNAPAVTQIASVAGTPEQSTAPAEYAQDIEAFNADLPAPPAQPTGVRQLQPAPWAAQGGSSGLFQPFGSEGSLALVSTPDNVLRVLGLNPALFAPQSGSMQFGAALSGNGENTGTPLSAMAALTPYNTQPMGDALIGSDAEAPSLFAQYDAATAADMARIATMDPAAIAPQDGSPPAAQEPQLSLFDEAAADAARAFQQLTSEFAG